VFFDILNYMQKPAFKKWNRSYDPKSTEPFKISRSKIDLFMECPRCFYLDARLAVKRPSGPSFTLNNAVDQLLKREFDVHRTAGSHHPLLQKYKVDAIPFNDPRMEEWRDALRRGIQYHHKPTNLIIRGGIDDIWTTPSGELIVVDYKATSKKEGPTGPDDLYDSYKRQIEVYQWLFRQNGFKVSDTGYFVYVNGRADAKAFDGKLEFDVNLIAYTGSDVWVAKAITDLHKTLTGEKIPEIGTSFGGGPCDFCTYREASGKAFKSFITKDKEAKKSRVTSEKIRKPNETQNTSSLF